jgi:hypothetical protein
MTVVGLPASRLRPAVWEDLCVRQWRNDVAVR